MKLKMKLIAAAVALAASAGANAAITNSASGNGELFFTIYDAGADLSSKDDDRAYVLDLGGLSNGGTMNLWTNNSVVTSPSPTLSANKQVASDHTTNPIYSIAADANLQSFIAASTDTSRLQWNIAAADSNGTDRVLITSNEITTAQTPIYTFYRTFAQGGIDGYLPYVNNAGIPDGGSILLTGDGAGLAAWSNNLGGRSQFTTTAGLGGELNFYLLSEKAATGSTTTLATVQQYMLDTNTAMTWKLHNDGTLTFAAAVPEPSEYALMLAGLGMIGFMARRRLANRV